MIKRLIDNFTSSGWVFGHNERLIKSRYEMFNITVMLSSVGLLYGLVLNTLVKNYFLLTLEIGVLLFNIAVLGAIRKWRTAFDYATTVYVLVFIALFTLLILNSEPDGVKHIWVYTFPAVILFFKGVKKGIFWTGILILTLVITHLQPYFPTTYTLYQIGYICFVLVIMTAIVMFYQYKMDQDNRLIFAQKEELESFAHDLENKIEMKTAQLRQLNTSLEVKVAEKVEELRHKDTLLLSQSRQAAMGEMLSMIAHQWRQPLSTITLQISNLKIRSMMHEIGDDEIHDALERISGLIMYLSETIDDFQSFFHPEKEPEHIGLCELLQRALSFTEARLEVNHIKLNFRCIEDTSIRTYSNEVSQAIINIINNAADELVKIDEKERAIDITVKKEMESAVIKIQDSAGGIREEVLPYIFDPYFSTKKKNGTGLGLYMGKMIVENHLQGTLSAANVDRGACFTITLPVELQNSSVMTM